MKELDVPVQFVAPPNAKVAAHHIVPVSLFRDPDIGGKLRKLGIDLNGPQNGVWLSVDDFSGRTASLHRATTSAGASGPLESSKRAM